MEQRMIDLCNQLLALIAQYGARSEEVRQFIKTHRHKGDFEKLAMTLLLLKEGLG